MSTEPKRISPVEAKALVDEGCAYLDVRSVPEFSQEHPVGAFNVPLLHLQAGGMVPNPDFLAVVKKTFSLDATVVVGCKAGGRSLRAAKMLLDAGFANVIDQRAGFDGARDAFGALTEPGWKPAGMPVEAGDGGDRSYEKLAR